MTIFVAGGRNDEREREHQYGDDGVRVAGLSSGEKSGAGARGDGAVEKYLRDDRGVARDPGGREYYSVRRDVRKDPGGSAGVDDAACDRARSERRDRSAIRRDRSDAGRDGSAGVRVGGASAGCMNDGGSSASGIEWTIGATCGF